MSNSPAPTTSPDGIPLFIVNELPFGIVVQDREGNITYANQAAKDILGLSLDQLLGRTSYDPRWRSVHEDGTEFQGQEHLAMQALHSGQPIRDVVMGVFHPQKETYRWINMTAVPHIPSPYEPADFVMTTFEDITERKEAEQSLRQSEERFSKEFYGNISPALIARAADGIIMEANDAFLELFEYPREQVIGHTSKELHLYLQPEQGDENVRVMQLHGNVHYVNTNFPTRTGKTITVIYSARLIEFNGVGHHIITMVDVTPQRRAESTLKETQQRLQLVVQAAKIGLWDWDLLTNQVYFSPEYQRMLGYEAGEFNKGYIEWESRIHPDDLERTTQTLQRFYANPYQGFWNEFRMRHKDGAYRWIFAQGELFYDDQGKPVRMMGSHIDITEKKRSEELARANEEKFRLAFNSGPVPRAIVQVDTARFVEVNQSFLEMYEFTPAQVIGHTPRELNIYVDDAEITELFRLVREQGYAHNQEMTVRTSSGKLRTVLHSTRLFTLDGIQYAITTAVDITERKKAEQALVESRAHYRGLLDGIDSAVVEEDREGTILFVNEVGARIWQSTPDQLIGKNIADLFSPEEAQLRLAAIRQVFDTKHCTVRELPMKTSDGRQLWFRTSVQPILDDSGIIPCVVILSTDITESKLAEQVIFESREDYRSLVESLEMQIVKVDRDGRYLFANELAAKQQGIPVEALIGKTIIDTLPPGVAEMQLAKIRRVIDSGESFIEEAPISINDDRIKWVRGHIQPVFDMTGKPVQAIMSSIDISELKQIQTQLKENAELLQTMNHTLERSLRAKDEFLAAMSHELRTPLAGILSSTESLLERVYGDLTDRQSHVINRIDKSGQRLLTLVNRVLEYTHLMSGRIELETMQFSPGELCEAGLRSVRELAATKKQALSYSILPEQLQITGDEIRLFQAISCLLENAVKFTPDGGRVELSVNGDAEDKQVKISVTDTGIGIAPEDLPRLFQPFVQLDARLARKYEGAGLGLVIAKGLVELHGGRIVVESTPEKGSSFTILLPWDQPE